MGSQVVIKIRCERKKKEGRGGFGEVISGYLYYLWGTYLSARYPALPWNITNFQNVNLQKQFRIPLVVLIFISKWFLKF